MIKTINQQVRYCLIKKQLPHWVRTSVLRAQYDASTLYLSAPLSLENVEVTLKDVYGNILFGDVVILTPTAYQIELGGFGVKNFVIELRTDEAEYYGEFSL